jgi:hypothetical protein
MANLAATYRQLGRYPEAEPLANLVLKKQRQFVGADPLDILRAIRKLATTYYKVGGCGPNWRDYADTHVAATGTHVAATRTQKLKKVFKRVWSWGLGI